MRIRTVDVFSTGGLLLAMSVCAFGAETPSVELALTFRPVQKDVEYETPSKDEYGDCQVKVERKGKASGWVVIGPAGQVLRRFVDTNGDNVVDQWRYFQRGLEVYRDVDGDYNNKVDQSRWLNTAGARWGLDPDEDGKIDSWKILSAQEAAMLAVMSVVNGDERTLKTILLNDDDIRELGIADEPAQALRARVAEASSRLRTVSARSGILSSETKWMRFDSSMPGIIPVDDGKAATDLMVYENAMAFVETRGEPGLVQIGEMIRVGDVWKLTQAPKPMEPNQVTEAGILMRPTLASVASIGLTAGVPNPEMQRLLKALQELDKNSPDPGAPGGALTRYNSQRADLLAKLVEISGTDEERNQWRRQMIDGLTSAVQTGNYEAGLARLEEMEAELQRTSGNSPLVPYATYRRMLAEYSLGIQQPDSSERQKAQEKWLADLEQFIERYPEAEDASEAMLHLAVNHEFSGKLPEAEKWYKRLVRDYADSRAGERAVGAVRRLELTGKELSLSGPGLQGGTIDVQRYRGQVLLVYYWSTWCKPCTEDLPVIRALYEQYHDRGFEIVGINLDSTPGPVEPYLSQHRVTWPQIYQPGGLEESKPATAYGIISLPTMFLVDKEGRVVNRNVSTADLKTLLPDLLKK